MATESEKFRTAYSIMMDYVQKGNYKSRNRVFIVHRLDRETSGVLVFAKTEAAKRSLQDTWETSEKKYLAVAHGKPEKAQGSFSSYLAENSVHVVYSTLDKTKGKLAQTDYRVLKQTKVFALLEVDLLTGRKNQIRVHFAEKGLPLVGDRKYGQKKDPNLRLALHSWSLKFEHPFTKQPMSIVAPIPSYFNNLVGDFSVSAD